MPYRIDFRSVRGDALDRLVELGAIDAEFSDDGAIAALMPDAVAPDRIANALGVDNVLSTAAPGWMEAAKARLGDGLARAAVDSVGGQASAGLMALLGEDGVLVSFGAMSGEPMQIPSGDMIFKHATVKGFWGARVGRGMPAADQRRLIGELIQRAASGELRLPVDSIHDLADVAQAVAASLRPARGGKVLLRA